MQNAATTRRDTFKLVTFTVSVTFLYFFCKTLFFALGIAGNISPDEVTWFGKALVYSNFFLLPVDSPETLEFGLIAHGPYLYFWLMGKLLHLNVFPVSDLVFLRCINIGLALGTIWFAWKTIFLLTESMTSRLLFLVLCTNTLMFTFLSAFVSYDNLVNLCAAASLYFLVAYFQTRTASSFLWFCLFTLAGCLTKHSFVPYAVLTGLVFFAREFSSLGSLLTDLKPAIRFKNVRNSGLVVLCVLLLGLNLQLHVGNFIKFGALSPSPVAVLGLENAMKYRIFARNYVVREFRNDNLSLRDALRMANEYIKHEGDRAGAYALLKIAAQEKQAGQPERMNRLQYALPWVNLMLSKTYGIMGHLSMEKYGSALVPYKLIWLFGGLLALVRLRPSQLNGNAVGLLFIFLGYALVLMQYVNYPTYYWSGYIGLALQGRYLFPVLFAGYALLAHYLTSFKSPKVNWVIASVVAAVFVSGEFPWFLGRATPHWFFAG